MKTIDENDYNHLGLLEHDLIKIEKMKNIINIMKRQNITMVINLWAIA